MEALASKYPVFSTFKSESENCDKPDFVYKRLASGADFSFNPYRPVEPLKSFFTPYVEKVSEYFGNKEVSEAGGKTVVFGIKACDLAAHRVQDYVFLGGEEEDPPYKLRRDNIIMVSGDCPDFKDVCFCLAMGGKPFPDSGFDLNLSPAGGGGFFAEPGSPAGNELIEAGGGFFKPASEEQVVQRDADRKHVVDRLSTHLEPQGLVGYENLQDTVKGGFDKDTWEDYALTCVECGGCNFICDTCHCFLLSDKKSGAGNHKMRSWDSCQYKNFATVAGGGNPMRSRAERLRNRFLKKFDFFVENMNQPACCGCGRCIEVCPGEIDIRDVLKDLAKNE